MTRYLTLILLALVITACNRAPTPTLDRTATQARGEEIGNRTVTAEATTGIRQSTSTSPPAPAATDTRTATQTAIPAPTATNIRTATHTTVPAPSSTATPIPTVATSIRSQDGMTMVYVAAGDFLMGNPLGFGSDEEAPQHMVTLDGFWIDRNEVTNDQYRTFVAATGYRAPTVCERGESTFRVEGKGSHPVTCVNWDDAQAYCKWAGGRLPTEAEWEKAARGTDRRSYPWGIPFDGTRLNYCDSNCDSDQKDTTTNDGYAQAAPVGSYPLGASPYGALDMAGNVWEWVGDWYNFYYYGKSPQNNPQGPNMGDFRVLRGGSWFGDRSNARSAFRAWLAPDKSDPAIGFRCVVPSPLSP